MAALTVQNFDIAGAVVTMSSAAGGGDTFVNDSSERTFFKIANGGAGTVTVTFASGLSSIQTAEFGTVSASALAITVAAGTTKYIGPFNSRRFNISGSVSVTYSGVTSVTVAAVKIGNA